MPAECFRLQSGYVVSRGDTIAMLISDVEMTFMCHEAILDDVDNAG